MLALSCLQQFLFGSFDTLVNKDGADGLVSALAVIVVLDDTLAVMHFELP